MEKRTKKSNKVESIISLLTLEIKKEPSTEKSMQRSLDKMNALLNDINQLDLSSCSTLPVQDFPSSFVAIAEPDFGIEIIEKHKLKGMEASTGRNNDFPSNPSQMTEKDPLVRYKDTISTIDNRTVCNNLELTTQANPNEQEMLNGKIMSFNLAFSIECNKCLSILWRAKERNFRRGFNVGPAYKRK